MSYPVAQEALPPLPQATNGTSSPIDEARTAREIRTYLQSRGVPEEAIGNTAIRFQPWNPFTDIRGTYVSDHLAPVITVNSLPHNRNRMLIHELEHRIDHATGVLETEAINGNRGQQELVASRIGLAASIAANVVVDRIKAHWHQQYPYFMPEHLESQMSLMASGVRVGYLASFAIGVMGYLSYRFSPWERRAYRAERTITNQLIVEK